MINVDRSAKIYGLKVFSSSKDELLKYLENHLESGKSLVKVFTPNPEQIVLSRENPKFKQALLEGDLLVPDGTGLVWGSQLLAWKQGSQPLAERIPGIELVEHLQSWSQENKQPVLIIGGREYQPVGDKKPAVTEPIAIDDHTRWMAGYLQKLNPTAVEETAVLATIAKLKPVIVYVALGAPVQETWIIDHQTDLEKAGVKIALTVGGSFDVILGKLSRAPGWMRQVGLEWLFRLGQEPWRWRRQTRLLRFIGITFQELIG